ncbi:MAG: glutathione S-transferase family protein [Kiloniellales bacterium]
MADFSITLGNKNYSSWSLRGWLPLKQCGADFTERVIPLRQPDSAARIRARSPSGRVPALEINDGSGLVIWDSLAIAEYLAERFPAAALWPSDPEARALARAVTAEMHSGFAALRTAMPMDLRGREPELGARLRQAPGVADDIARIVAIWQDCRARVGDAGDFLFGRFCIADIAFAPVASRFVTYGVLLPELAAAYRDAVMAWPAMQDWAAAAEAEPWTIDFPERDRLVAVRPARVE